MVSTLQGPPGGRHVGVGVGVVVVVGVGCPGTLEHLWLPLALGGGTQGGGPGERGDSLLGCCSPGGAAATKVGESSSAPTVNTLKT
jgi:hypothetical protein